MKVRQLSSVHKDNHLIGMIHWCQRLKKILSRLFLIVLLLIQLKWLYLVGEEEVGVIVEVGAMFRAGGKVKVKAEVEELEEKSWPRISMWRHQIQLKLVILLNMSTLLEPLNISFSESEPSELSLQ
jgi:hypothetical protein